ncbi:unnamed protein product [Paramecium pentaurelia]|uniref:Uncharacterized protein n=1 Tax=Paramecium pentaurelia TaxID=43138 RepID=A0A8S1UFK9_9CILI|nr:unnamed protein product [Paramecium pentaurelia]
MNRDLELARQAYMGKNVEMTKQAHNYNPSEQLYTDIKVNENDPLKKQDSHTEKHSTGGNYLRSSVFGGMDGMMTTFSVVTAVIGGNFGVQAVLALGVANMIGDGLSMALGDYLSTKSEQQFFKQEREREKWEVENNLEGEKKEMVELYKKKGMEQEDAEKIMNIISRHKDAFIDIMMLEELELGGAEENPLMNALVTFIAFILFGLVPIIPFIVAAIAGLTDGTTDTLFYISIAMTILFLIILGVSKSFFSYATWWRCAAETLFVGACTASSSYLIGMAFEGQDIG